MKRNSGLKSINTVTMYSTVSAVLIVLVAALVAAYAFTMSNKQDGNGNVVHVQSASANTIVYSNDGFSPRRYVVRAGDVITIQNDSNKQLYFTTGDHHNHNIDSPLNAGEVKPGETTRFTAPESGVYSFHNHYDDTESGTLVVE